MRRDVEVSLEFLPTSGGGRQGPVRSGYRPQFCYDDHDWDAVHEFPDADEVFPGDRARAFITFLFPSAHWGRLGAGKTFSIREGGRVVAHGRIEQLLDLCESAIREQLHELLESRYRQLGLPTEVDPEAKLSHEAVLREFRRLRDLIKAEAAVSEIREAVLRANAAMGTRGVVDASTRAGTHAFGTLITLLEGSQSAG